MLQELSLQYRITLIFCQLNLWMCFFSSFVHELYVLPFNLKEHNQISPAFDPVKKMLCIAQSASSNTIPKEYTSDFSVISPGHSLGKSGSEELYLDQLKPKLFGSY